MPRGKRKNDESEEDEESTQSSKTKKKRQLDQQERDKLVGDLMRYALFQDYKKAPVKRADIVNNITKEHKDFTNEILKISQKKFKEIFGYELVEAPKSSKKSGSNVYILRTLNNELPATVDFDKQTQSEQALLMLVLGMIYINNKQISQDQLFDQLRRLGFNKESSQHPQFGEWQKLIESQFVKQMYLERKKGDGTDRDGKQEYIYKIGARSILEIEMKNILQFVSEIYGDTVEATELQELEEDENEGEEGEEEEVESQATQSRSKNPNANSNESEEPNEYSHYDLDDSASQSQSANSKKKSGSSRSSQSNSSQRKKSKK